MNNLKEFERIADEAFSKYNIPHPNGYVARWYLLTVSEDSQRLLLSRSFEEDEAWGIEHFIDRSKFSLRHCLSRVQAEASNWSSMPLPTKALEQLYVRAQSLLLAGWSYSIASQICSSAYSGSANILKEEGAFNVELVRTRTDGAYAALEIMRQSAGEFFAPHYLLFRLWSIHTEQWPHTLWQIVASTRLRNRRILYRYDPNLAFDLAQQMHQPPFLIPDQWKFLWGGRHETTVLLNAVSVRTLYHLAAVQFGANRFELKGGAEHDLCLVQTRKQWIEDIELISSVEKKNIEIFLDQLTYGAGSTTPDQALQPFIPLGAGFLGLGPLGWLSSNQERNLLSLQARLQTHEMDSQSHLFEVDMTAKLQTAIESRWSLVKANRTFSNNGHQEEFDLLICEPDTKTVLILELRWILPPGDPREVEQKSKVCRQKTVQAARKRDFLKLGLREILKIAFGVHPTDVQDWKVSAIAVIEGFGGVPSPDPTVPLMPEWVILAGISTAQTLRGLVEWAIGLDWLPKLGSEYDLIQEMKPWVEDFELQYPAIVPLRTGRSYLADVLAALERDSPKNC